MRVVNQNGGRQVLRVCLYICRIFGEVVVWSTCAGGLYVIDTFFVHESHHHMRIAKWAQGLHPTRSAGRRNEKFLSVSLSSISLCCHPTSQFDLILLELAIRTKNSKIPLSLRCSGSSVTGSHLRCRVRALLHPLERSSRGRE